MENPYVFDCNIKENISDNLEYFFQQNLIIDLSNDIAIQTYDSNKMLTLVTKTNNMQINSK
jgi:hypothetical protein